jgi:hypothetical protein
MTKAYDDYDDEKVLICSTCAQKVTIEKTDSEAIFLKCQSCANELDRLSDIESLFIERKERLAKKELKSENTTKCHERSSSFYNCHFTPYIFGFYTKRR